MSGERLGLRAVGPDDRAPVPIRVAVLHDAEVVATGFTEMMRPYAGRIVVVPSVGDEAGDAEGGDGPRTDIALSDLRLDLPDAAADLRHLRHACNADRIVVFCRSFTPALVDVAVIEGASGYLSMTLPAEELLVALEEVVHGDTFVTRAWTGDQVRHEPEDVWSGKGSGLSRRESEVVHYIFLGLSNREVAAKAYLSINTVKTYIRSAYWKMGVTGRATAVIWAKDHGFGDDEPYQRHRRESVRNDR